MNPNIKIAIAVGLMIVIGGIVVLRQGGSSFCCPGHPGAAAHHTWDNENTSKAAAEVMAPSDLPRLVELGSTTCIPCQMMKPIIEELTADYAGRLEVVFVDVQKDPQKAERFDIQTIPTQVFVAPSGKELFRNIGMLSKEEILDKWATLGYDLTKSNSND